MPAIGMPRGSVAQILRPEWRGPEGIALLEAPGHLDETLQTALGKRDLLRERLSPG